ncbi:hypothetical protein O181_008898 [Austropuccinia psidii MF-1]|uniref:Protein ZIP4 homolog n=1 Tax=Austropuccinia psidii MF-1 TaxID=1389203 RepID=A0A9Q3BQB4_9BASI|nr:hypothetical protein [Austropuccinia psidii MF-1]
MEANHSSQRSRCRECHKRLFDLLDKSRERILGYHPTELSSQSDESQDQLAILTDLTTLLSLAKEFSSLLKKLYRAGSSSGLHSRPADHLQSNDHETYENWMNELDLRGVELWNRASQLRRLLDNNTQLSLQPAQKSHNTHYDECLQILYFQNSNQTVGQKRQRVIDATLLEKICASMRQLAFIMIHAGSPIETNLMAKLKLLEISAKSAKAQLSVYDLDSAMKNIELALELEDQIHVLVKGPESLAKKDDAFAYSMINYYSVKADCSWASGNETGALFNLRKALEILAKYFGAINSADAIKLISRFYTLACGMLKPLSQFQEAAKTEESKRLKLLKASEWLTIALHELDSDKFHTSILTQKRLDHNSPLELKIKIIKALAYSFLEASSYEGNENDDIERKGERALDQALVRCSLNRNLSKSLRKKLTCIIFICKKKEMKPNQQMWLRKIQLLAKRKSFGAELRLAFKSALQTSPFNDQLVYRLMSVSHKVPDEKDRSEAFSQIFSACVVRNNEEERKLGDAAFYAIILNSVDSKKAIKKPPQGVCPPKVSQLEISQEARLKFLKDTADSALLDNSEYRLAPDCALMSQTVVWHFADQYYQDMKFEIAAKWYSFGTHGIFLAIQDMTFSKLTRKAALCWVNHGNYDLARDCLKALFERGNNEAGTHFINFMIDSAQGNEAPAMQAIDRIMSSIDFKPEMLLYAARQANQRGLQKLLYHVLQKVLEASLDDAGSQNIQGLDVVVLLRSLIRIDLSDIHYSGRDIISDAERTLQHYRIAKEMMIQADTTGRCVVSAKDATWLWKTAFNSCISATTNWPESLVFEFFGLTADLISLTRKIPTNLEEVRLLVRHEIHCRFAYLAGTMSQALSIEIGEHNRDELYQSLTESLTVLKKLCESTQEFPTDNAYFEKLMRIRACLCVWEFEIYVLGDEWDAIKKLMRELESANQSHPFVTNSVLESIAEIACQTPRIPLEVLIVLLQHILSILENKSGASVELCSRWLRLIVDLELSMGKDKSALEYSNKALQLKHHHMNEYPADEANWLLAKSWDRSIDLYTSHDIPNSKLWCEMAMKWMEVVVGGRAYEGMMNRHYRDLLKLAADLDQKASFL